MRSFRLEKGYSQMYVARETGLHPATIFNMERGRSVPQERTIKTLLAMYRVEGEQYRSTMEMYHRVKSELMIRGQRHESAAGAR